MSDEKDMIDQPTGSEAEQKYNSIPEERVFVTLKAYLKPDNGIAASLFYNGEVVEELTGGNMSVGLRTWYYQQELRKAATRIRDEVAVMNEVGKMLSDLLGIDKEEEHDSKTATASRN